MRFLFFLFIILALLLAIRSETEDLNEEEEYILSKYQSLVSATLSGRDITDEDFPESSLDYAVPDVPIPEDFLAKMRMEDGLEMPDVPLLVSAVTEKLSNTDDVLPQTATINATIVEGPVNSLSFVEETLLNASTTTDSQTHQEASPPSPVKEPVHSSDSARNEQANITAAVDIHSHKDEVPANDDIAAVIHTSAENNTPELETKQPLVCEATVVEVRPAYLINNPSADILERLSRDEQSQEIVPIVSSILSDFETSQIAHKRCTTPSAGSEDDTVSTCTVDVSYLSGLKLLHRDDVAGIAQELHVCRDHADAITTMQYKSEQQRDLAEIRLKKCRNDITVMKVTAEQQRLVVEEEKVDLEFRLKEAQREIARLRLAVEDLKRAKIQPSSLSCDCKNTQDTAGARPALGTTGEHTPTTGSQSSRMFTTPATLPNAHAHTDKGTNAKTQDTERREGALSYKVSSPLKSPITSDLKNTSVADHHDATISLGSTLSYSLPNWIRHQCAPYMLSFVVWEYRVLFMASNLVASVVDPRIWAFIRSSIVDPIHERISVMMQAMSVDLLALLDRAQVAFPWTSWMVHRLRDGMHIFTHFSSRYQRFYAEDASNSAVDVVHDSPVNATEPTRTLSQAVPLTYADLVEYILEDVHGAYSACVTTIASVSQLKLLLGSRTDSAARWITFGIVVVVMILLRKMLLGFMLLALLISFFPILLALLVASSTVSVFMPRKRKIVKKRARKVTEGTAPEHSLPQSSQRNEAFPAGPPTSSYYQQAASSQSSPRTFIGVRP